MEKRNRAPNGAPVVVRVLKQYRQEKSKLTRARGRGALFTHVSGSRWTASGGPGAFALPWAPTDSYAYLLTVEQALRAIPKAAQQAVRSAWLKRRPRVGWGATWTKEEWEGVNVFAREIKRRRTLDPKGWRDTPEDIDRRLDRWCRLGLTQRICNWDFDHELTEEEAYADIRDAAQRRRKKQGVNQWNE